MVRCARLVVRLSFAIAILSGVMGGTPKADTNPVIGLFLGYSKAVNAVALSANGRQALSGGQDNVLRLWDIPTGLLLRTLDAQANRINAVAFSPDGHQILSGGSDKRVRIWTVTTGQADQNDRRARGRGSIGRLLAGRQASAFGKRRQHGQAVGCGNGRSPQDLRGAFRCSAVRCLLARWAKGTVGGQG